MKFFFRPLGELIDRAVCLLFALAFAQLPLYISQYVDVLTGALTEARINYEDLEKRAASLIPPLSVEAFIQHHLDSEDSVFKSSGEHFQEMVNRLHRYEASYQALTTCSLWQKPFVFMQNIDPNLQKALVYKPGLPMNYEGLSYLLAGLLVGLILIMLVRALLKKLFSLTQKTTPPTA